MFCIAFPIVGFTPLLNVIFQFMRHTFLHFRSVFLVLLYRFRFLRGHWPSAQADRLTSLSTQRILGLLVILADRSTSHEISFSSNPQACRNILAPIELQEQSCPWRLLWMETHLPTPLSYWWLSLQWFYAVKFFFSFQMHVKHQWSVDQPADHWRVIDLLFLDTFWRYYLLCIDYI